MTRFIILLIAVFVLPAACLAQQLCPQQIVTTSWHGLSGLYVIPTARMLGERKFAVGFNESKHSEHVGGGRYVDRQIRGVGTYGITDRIEIYASYWNNMFMLPPDREPGLDNQTFHSFGAKFLVIKEHPHFWFPAVAIAVRDVTNNTADVGPLHNINNGTKGFILASKRLLKDDRIGRFMDIHAGLTFDANTTAGLCGFELTLAPNASLIAEGIWDSPYLNFRDYGKDGVRGRYLFNVGIRMYPELVPGMALDTGFVGDGEFEFSFGASYVISL